jgi:hypothetical protein
MPAPRPTLSGGLAAGTVLGTPAISKVNLDKTGTGEVGRGESGEGIGTLGKRKLRELIESVGGPGEKLEDDVEDVSVDPPRLVGRSTFV